MGGTGETFNWDLAIEAKKLGRPIFLAGGLTPQIDRRFPFSEAPAAYAYLQSGAHLGKVMIVLDRP